jgi:predicted pyridoxine 5'-phosphate oxidase superfamily flavin-nucleotide-binding protein
MASKLTANMKRVVAEQRLAFVATVCPDGTPNVSPKGTIAVWDDEHLVFADIRSPGTIANLTRNPAIEVNVVDPFVRKGFRFKGTAEVVRDGERFAAILDFYRGRLVDTSSRKKMEAAVRAFVLVKVERALPLTSPAYDDGSDEESIRSKWISYYSSLHQKAEKDASLLKHS